MASRSFCCSPVLFYMSSSACTQRLHAPKPKRNGLLHHVFMLGMLNMILWNLQSLQKPREFPFTTNYSLLLLIGPRQCDTQGEDRGVRGCIQACRHGEQRSDSDPLLAYASSVVVQRELSCICFQPPDLFLPLWSIHLTPPLYTLAQGVPSFSDSALLYVGH